MVLARILDEIAGSRRAEILLGYALATLAGNFVLQLFKSAVEKVCGQKEAQMWALFGKVFSDKQMRMDYVDLENARVQAQKKQAEETSSCLAMGWRNWCGAPRGWFGAR